MMAIDTTRDSKSKQNCSDTTRAAPLPASHETTATARRSLSFIFAPGPNRSWKLISSSMSSSIIFIVEDPASGPRPSKTIDEDAPFGACVRPSCDDSVAAPSRTAGASARSRLDAFSSPVPAEATRVVRDSRKATSTASLLRPLSIALACSLPTHSTSARTRLFMSPTLMRLLGHLTLTPRSCVRSQLSDPFATVPNARTSSGRGALVGNIGSRWER